MPIFSKKWYPQAKRVEYTSTFSSEKWKALPDSEKDEHTLSNCKACLIRYDQLQTVFPGKPMYILPQPTPLIILPDEENLGKAKERKLGRKVLQELNSVWEDKFEHPITNVIPKLMPETNLTQKVSKSQRRIQNRKQKRQFVQEVNQHFAQNATMSVLAEAESLASYSRKRLSYSFDTPIPPKRHKSHSPKEENLGWDVQSAMETLKSFPENKKINWSDRARKFNVPQKNGGQVLKETAQKDGIVMQTDSTPRLRRSKTKLLGGEISIPSLPTKEAIVQEKKSLIASGEHSIGEPCLPYTVTKSIVNG